jgi:hypothetical protein
MKTANLLLVTLKVTPEGVWEIPMSAWNPIHAVVTEDFSGTMKLHDHDSGGQFHDFPYIPVAYYVLEITVDENKKAQLLAALKPLIAEIVRRYRREIAVPAGK